MTGLSGPFSVDDADTLHEECGVFGIFGHPGAGALTVLGLHALQHRGQEAAGVVTYDHGQFIAERHPGLVGDIFGKKSDHAANLKGDYAIGHNRYSTAGGSAVRNIQPLFADLTGGGIAIVGIAYLVFTAVVPVDSQPGWVANARLMPVIRASAEVVASLIPDRNVRVRDSRGEIVPEKRRDTSESDALPPDMAARKAAESQPIPAPRPKQAKHAKKTYGAKDRQALDRLIETTDSDKSGKP